MSAIGETFDAIAFGADVPARVIPFALSEAAPGSRLVSVCAAPVPVKLIPDVAVTLDPKVTAALKLAGPVIVPPESGNAALKLEST